MNDQFKEKCTTGPGTRPWLDEVVTMKGNPSHEEGKKAFLEGKPRSAVPIDGTFERAFLWICGWHDARKDSSSGLADDTISIIRQICDAPAGSFRVLKPGA